MNYKVLYRKYRPASFSQMVGQEYTIQMLQNAVKYSKISHAYLFTGPRGTGKTSTAKIFAKTINCLDPLDGEACGKCPNCLNFSESPDIIEIDAASNNGVDDIRELINNVKIAPSLSKFKIYIIDEVHMMTDSAFNALLLTLEEPPKHAIFIMATTNVENVPITILSRCQRFNFEKISLDNLKKQIQYVCREEEILISEDAIEEIAYLSEGGMRDALSLLDQLSSNSEEITLDSILSHYGSISSKFIKDLIYYIDTKDVTKIIESFQNLENTSSDYKVFLKKLIQELTHISVNIKLGTYTGTLSYKQIKKMVFEFNDIMNKANINMNPFVLIKLSILDVFDIESVVLKEDVLFVQKDEKNIEEKEPTVSSDVPRLDTTLENTAFIDDLKKVRVNNCFVSAKKEELLNYQKIWKELASNVQLKPDIVALILDSSLVAASKDYCIISCKLLSTANLINSRLLELTDVLKEFFVHDVKFIALSEEEWLKEKQQYVTNLKSKYVYQLMKEQDLEVTKNKNSVSEIENVATNIFNRDKIEIV